MASLEMAVIRREADDRARRPRNLFGRIFFRPDSRPVKPLRRLLFHTSGAPRRFLRPLVLHKNGTPRSAFAQWMGSVEYLGLSNAVKRPGTPGHKTRRCRNGVLIRVMNLRPQLKLKLPNRIGVSPTRCKSVSPVGTARRNPLSRNCERRGMAGGSAFPVRSPHRKRLLPSSLRNSR